MSRPELRRDQVVTVEHMDAGFLSRAAPLIDRLLGLKSLARFYARIPEDCGLDEFLDRILAHLEVELEVEEQDLARIPNTGPVVVVANHPFGGIEGIALARLLRTLHPDVKVMANYLLGRIPEMTDLFFLVDPFASPSAARRNVGAIRKAVRFLADGGMLVVFPAGEVAHLHLRSMRVEDPPWDPIIGRIIRRSGCPVLPVHFAGRNSNLFQLLGLVHPKLRTAMLAREFLGRKGKPIKARVGHLLPPKGLARWPTDEQMITSLRRRTEILAQRSAAAARPRGSDPVEAAAVCPVVAAVAADDLEREVLDLPAEQLLVDADKQAVFVAEAQQIPALLREIGRLRELTFRAVGEGSGKELDLDDFDSSYRHLFIWHQQAREVVGAYRLGLTDQLLAASGVHGLYSSTLFRYSPELFTAMGPALEMGRSFIRIEHQKSFTGLMLLWKGIGRFVLAHPSYSTLFGPVSISADYTTVSQQMVVAFLRQNTIHHQWSKWVSPRRPFRQKRNRNYLPNPADLRSLDEVSSFVADVEADGKGVPILLKQYLKLGGRMLGCNIDPEFSNVLDVLILVDLSKTAPAILARYMGRDGAESFLAAAT